MWPMFGDFLLTRDPFEQHIPKVLKCEYPPLNAFQILISLVKSKSVILDPSADISMIYLEGFV